MTYSFRTNGNFIDFVHTDNTSLQVESVLRSLHNTSRAVTWSLPEDETRINFTVDDIRVEGFPISEIDFDGTPIDSQDDFETGITAMFTGLAGGGSPSSSYLVETKIMDNDEILGMPDTLIQIVPDPGAGKVAVFLWGYVIPDFVSAYGNLPDDEGVNLAFTTSTNSTDVSNTLDGVSNMAFMFGDTQNPPSIYRTISSSSNNAIFMGGLSDIENKGIALYLNTSNDHGDFTGGHANNTMKVIVGYSIVDL